MVLWSCSGVRELRRKRGGGAGEGVEDQEGEDGRQVQRSPERRDDAPEDVQVGVTDRAAFALASWSCMYTSGKLHILRLLARWSIQIRLLVRHAQPLILSEETCEAEGFLLLQHWFSFASLSYWIID